MSKALAFVRLDFITVKPYFTLKNLVLMLISPLIIFMSSGSSSTAVSMLVVFASLYVSYPFAVCEKSSMDALYATLSIPREIVVLGRYLFVLAFNLCAGLIALVLALITSGNVSETLLYIPVMLVILTLGEAIQLPIYFKLGYDKAKLFAYLPFITFALATIIIASTMPKTGGPPKLIIGFFELIGKNPASASAIAAVVWLLIMLVSYWASLNYYRRRDF